MSLVTERNRILLPDGSTMSKLGQGTWQMGEDDEKLQREVDGLKHGIEIGIDLIDTAEMYADGKAENIVGNAITDFDREKVYLLSKVYPENANRHRIYSSVQRSLKLMNADYLDMYLHGRFER